MIDSAKGEAKYKKENRPKSLLKKDSKNTNYRLFVMLKDSLRSLWLSTNKVFLSRSKHKTHSFRNASKSKTQKLLDSISSSGVDFKKNSASQSAEKVIYKKIIFNTKDKFKKNQTFEVSFKKLKKLFRHNPLLLKRSIAMVTVLATVGMVYFQYAPNSQGASYTWAQTSWDADATVGSTVTHPETTSKTSYESKDNIAIVNEGGTDLQLSSVDSAVIQTDNSDSNTGFNLSGATQSNTTVVGNGEGTNVSLTSKETAPVWDRMATVPGTVSSGGDLVSTGGDYMYGYKGGSTTTFYRYSITGNSWTTMTATPGTISSGGSLVYPGSGDFIYGYRGGLTTTFYRYSILGNSWTTMAVTPGAIGNGGGDLVYPGSGDYIYGYQGNGTTAFYRYSISGNSWTTMTATPGTIGAGGSLVYPGSGDYIYGYGQSYAFYRYSISGNSWTTMANTPSSVYDGSTLVYPGFGDYIYGCRGNSTTFYRYSISGNFWTTMASSPESIRSGGSLVYPGSGNYFYGCAGNSSTTFLRYAIKLDNPGEWVSMAQAPINIGYGAALVSAGGDYVYGYAANNSTNFYRYSTSDNSWSIMASTPGVITGAGALVYPGSGDYIYGYKGSSIDFYRYSISANSWATMANTPGTIGAGGALAYPGSGDYIYGYQGNSSTTFYRYSISGNSWTMMATTPGSISNGASLVYSGSDDYIYGYQGWNSTAFYRYSISGNSWTTMATIPAGIGAGGALVYPGSGDYIYGYKGSSTDFYRYSISANSWTTMAATPGLINSGGALVYPGSGDYIYGYQGTGITFYRYSISANSWTTMAATPGLISSGGALVYPGSGDFMYSYQGNSTTTFYRYSISGNSWAIMAATPGSISSGGALVYPESGDYIYGYQGGTTAFYRYSISGNSWTTMAVTPAAIGSGGALVYPGSGDYIYGYGQSSSFYRYSISGNSWTTMAVTPGSISSGGALVYPESGDYIYGYKGGSTDFYRYSISDNYWSTMTVTPGVITGGGALVYPGSGDYIYGTRGSSTDFYRYSISGNSWILMMTPIPSAPVVSNALVYPGSGNYIYGLGSNSNLYRYTLGSDVLSLWNYMATTPGNINDGGALVYPGSGDYIYGYQGNGTTAFYRYSISGNSWTTMTATPGTIGAGGALVYPGSGDYIYGYQGNGTTAFYRYSISGNSWTTMAVTPAAIGGGGALVYPGSGDYIYGYQGNSTTTFYRYSILGNSWTTMAVTPAAIGSGGALVYPGSGDYIYGYGQSNSFYRYSISGNSWSTLAATPDSISSAGSSLVYPGSGDYIYGSQGISTDFYRYSISGNSWTTMKGVPNHIRAGCSLVYPGSGPYIYGYQGGLSNIFYSFSLYPYASSGTYTSGIIDTGQKNSNWGNVSWNANLNSQIMTIKARSCDDSTCSSAGSVDEMTLKTWESCGIISNNNSLTSGAPNCVSGGDRYIQYQATLNSGDPSKSPILNDISLNFSYYSSSGTLISSAFDSSSTANAMGSLLWTEDSDSPANTTTTISLRSADSQANLNTALWTDFTQDTTNCTKENGIVTCNEDATPAELKDAVGDQWFQYKTTLTSDGASTPTVNDVSVQYVVNSPPEFDTTSAVAAVQLTNEDATHPGEVKIDFSIRDVDASSGSFTPNYVAPTFEYSLDGGANFTGFNQDNISFGDNPVGGERSSYNGRVTVKVLEDNYLTYTAYWNAKAAIDGNFTDQFKIRVSINDGESANNTAAAISNTTSLDVKNPDPFAFNINHKDNILTFYTPPTDDSTFKMLASNRNDFSDVTAQDYASPYIYNTPPQTLTNDPATVHVRIEDNYGNQRDVQSVTPGKPMNLIYFDTSSSTQEIYQEFIAWDVLSAAQVGAGFTAYEIYRKIDDGDFELLDTATDRNNNYYLDKISGLDSNVNYSDSAFDSEAPSNYTYKILTTDINGNISAYSETVSDTPNGTGGSDSTPPTISNITITNINTTSAKVSWTTDELSDSSVGFSSQVECDNNPDQTCFYLPERGLSSMVTEHEIILTGLIPGTDYTIRVKSHDVAVNLGQNDKGSPGSTPIANFSFATLPGPAISNVTVSSIHNNQATITWKTTTDSNTYVIYSDTIIEEGLLVDPEEVGVPTLVGGSAPFDHTQTINTYKGASLVAGTVYYFYVKSIDGAGNVATSDNGTNLYQLLTTMDNNPPVVSSISAAIINNTQAAIRWVTDEPADSKVIYTTGSGGPYESEELVSTYDASHFVIISGLEPDTQYYYQVISKDINGNETITEENTFQTITNPSFQHEPLSIISDIDLPTATISDTHAVVNFNTDQAAICYVQLTTKQDSYLEARRVEEGGYAQQRYGLTHTISLVNLNPKTTYYFYLFCQDNLLESGDSVEISSETETQFTTLEKLQTEAEAGDVSAPVISDIMVTDLTYKSATIKWTTDEASNSLVDYGVNDSYGESHGDREVSTTTHTVTIPNLEPSTTYYFKTSSYDAASNIATQATDGEGAVLSFTTLSASLDSNSDGTGDQLSDIVKNIWNLLTNHDYTEADIVSSFSNISVISSNGPSAKVTNNTTVTVTWTTNNQSNGRVIYWQEGKSESSASSTAEVGNTNTQHEVIVKNLNAQITYNYYVMSTTLLGSEFKSATKTFTTGDTPSIAGISVTDISLGSAIVSWTTNAVTSLIVEYGSAAKYDKQIASPSSSQQSIHTVKLENLEAGKEYHLRILGTDADEETVSSDDYAFITLSLPVISNIDAQEVTAEGAKITWKTNTKTDSSVEYKLQEAEVGTTQGKLETVIDHEVTLKDLVPGTVYEYRVFSKDPFENKSESEFKTFTTPDDSDPPVIRSVKSEATIFPNKESKIQTVISWVTNKPASSIVAYREGVTSGDDGIDEKIKDNNSSEYNGWKIQRKEDNSPNHVFVFTDFNPASIYYFKVASVDKRGNISISDNYSLLSPVKNKSILDLIVANFENTFGWMKDMGK